jgi:hypothetical protein
MRGKKLRSPTRAGAFQFSRARETVSEGARIQRERMGRTFVRGGASVSQVRKYGEKDSQRSRPVTCATSCYEIDPRRWIHHP